MPQHTAVEAAEKLQPLIRAHQAAGEERARLAPEVVAAAGAAGLFRVYAPTEVGGHEASPATVFAVQEAVSVADPALGWYIANSLAVSHVAAFLDDAERAVVYAEPDLHTGFSGVPGARAIPCEGGYRVSGRWPLVTGGEDAGYCALGGFVYQGDAPRQRDGQPDSRLFLIPSAELDITPTWQEASAMRGTGSNAAELEDVFVPDGLVYTPGQSAVLDRPHYRVPLWLVFIATNTGVIAGALRDAVEAGREALSTKVSSYTGTAVRDEIPILELITHCHAATLALRSGMARLVEEVDAALAAGDPPADALKADIYAYYFYANETARDTVSRLFARGTRAGFVRGNALERALRNLHAICIGSEPARSLQHTAGRVLLGGAPDHPSF